MKVIKILYEKNIKIILEDGSSIDTDYDSILEHKIVEGMDIDNLLISQLSDEMSKKQCLNYAMSYLTKYSKSRKHLINKLYEKEYKKNAIDYAIEKLEEYGYIDDYKYATNIVNSNIKKLGKHRLKSLLYEKGIPSDIIQDVLEEIDKDDMFSTCVSLVKKWLGSHDFESNKDREKLFRFMTYRGFDYDMIKNALWEIENNDN